MKQRWCKLFKKSSKLYKIISKLCLLTCLLVLEKCDLHTEFKVFRGNVRAKKKSIFLSTFGGFERIRTAVLSFADWCLAARPRNQTIHWIGLQIYKSNCSLFDFFLKNLFIRISVPQLDPKTLLVLRGNSLKASQL